MYGTVVTPTLVSLTGSGLVVGKGFKVETLDTDKLILNCIVIVGLHMSVHKFSRT